jgi:hypothetical protein
LSSDFFEKSDYLSKFRVAFPKTEVLGKPLSKKFFGGNQ